MSSRRYQESQSATQFRVIAGEVIPMGRVAATPTQDARRNSQRRFIQTRGDECNANVTAKSTIHEGPETTITGRAALENDIEIGRSNFSGDKVSDEGSVRQGTKTTIGDAYLPPESEYHGHGHGNMNGNGHNGHR